MIHPPPRSPLFPYTTLFRSSWSLQLLDADVAKLELARLGLQADGPAGRDVGHHLQDRKSTRLNSSHRCISYAVFCLKKKKKKKKKQQHKKRISNIYRYSNDH